MASRLIEINADLHIHGLYSGGVSDRMIPSVIGEQAPFKGLHVIGTGDILNEKWIKLVKEQLNCSDEGIPKHVNGTKFILQTEVEDRNRVHHIILFPSLSKVYELREAFGKKCKSLDTDGRPKLWMDGEEIAQQCRDSGCLIGFAHAFTPYFGLYSKFNSYKQCYGSRWKDISFMELGLSADTEMGDMIKELHELTFTSNSDCHSPWPNKLGREFNRLLVSEISFEEIAKALRRDSGRSCTLNVKFNPKEGKYHKTRCKRCLLFFELKDAVRFNWKCPECKGVIKKGVYDRVAELSDASGHPEHRAKCIHTIPLSEIIALALDIKSAYSAKIQDMWKNFIDRFGSEISALLDAYISELEEVDEKVARYIRYFREDRIKYIPGGAGIYGKLVPPDKKLEIKIYRHHQKSLQDFKQ